MEPYPTRYSIAQLREASLKLNIKACDLLVSLDHDFFYPGSDPTIQDPDLHDELVLSGAVNWRVDEWFSQDRASRVWDEHANRLVALGENPHHWGSAAKSPAPEQVFEHLTTWHELNHVYQGDSHLWGLVCALALYNENKGPIDLVHYDAHHDCGYINYPGDSVTKSQLRAEKGACCDDWIHVGLNAGIFRSVTIVYPDWRGVNEWYTQAPATIASEHEQKISVTTWTEWASLTHPKRQALGLYARSSAFVPPWSGADQNYLDWSQKLHTPVSCLDCDHDLVIGSQNACHTRPAF